MSDILETSAAEPAAPSSGGGAPNQDGNTFVESGEAKATGTPSDRAGPGWKEGLDEAINEARARIDGLSSRDEQPIDLDAPREWQGPEARQRAEEVIKGLQRQQQPPQPPARPEKMPRGWSNEEISEWNALSPAQQERVAEREAKRERDFLTRQNEVVSKQREVEATVAQAEQFNLASLEALLPELQPFAHLTPQQFEELGRTNPQEAARVRDLYARAETLSKRVEALAQQRAERHRAQAQQEQAQIQQAQQEFFDRARQSWEQQKQAEDAAIAKLIPELADPAKREEITKAVYAYTDKLGISREQLHHYYETEPLLRGAVGQRVLHDAAQWNKAQQRAFEARPVPTRKPMMPGTNNGSGGRSDDAAAAARAGDMASYISLRNATDRRARR